MTRRRRRWLALGPVAAVLAGMTAASAVASPPPGGRVRVEDELPATANHSNRPRASNSPQLTVDPTDPQVLAMANRVDGPEFSCALQLSADGGRGWAPANPVPELPAGADRCYAPEVAFDARGALHYLFVGLAGTTNVPMGVFLTTSTDRGNTFSAPQRVLGAYSFAVRLAADTSVGDVGRLHLVWLAARGEPGLGSFPTPPNPIMASHSDDAGRTWSRPVRVSDPDRAYVVAPALAVADGAVHVLYYDLGEDARDYHGLEGPVWDKPWSLVLATSTDGGRRFAPGVVVDAAAVPPERVMLIFTMAPPALLAAGDGRLFAAWHDGRNGDWDAFLRRSTDGGRTWAPPVRLNDDGRRGRRHQYQPRLALAPNGRLDAVFYDRRGDAENLRNNVAYTSSTDGGRTFSANRMLSSKPSDSRIGQTYVGPAAIGQVEFGSRIGLVSGDDRAVAAWTDTRNAIRPVYQDVFAAVVHVAGTARSGAGVGAVAPVAVATVAGAGIGMLGVARRRRRASSPAGPRR